MLTKTQQKNSFEMNTNYFDKVVEKQSTLCFYERDGSRI